MHALKTTPIALGVLFASALLVRLAHVVRASFDGLYGQDAYAYYQYAGELLAAITRGQAPPPFWWPLGYPALLSAALAVGGGVLRRLRGLRCCAEHWSRRWRF